MSSLLSIRIFFSGTTQNLLVSYSLPQLSDSPLFQKASPPSVSVITKRLCVPRYRRTAPRVLTWNIERVLRPEHGRSLRVCWRAECWKTKKTSLAGVILWAKRQMARWRRWVYICRGRGNMRQMVICWLICHRAPFAHLHSGKTWPSKDPRFAFLPLSAHMRFPTSPLMWCFYSMSAHITIFLHAINRFHAPQRHYKCQLPLNVVDIVWNASPKVQNPMKPNEVWWWWEN